MKRRRVLTVIGVAVDGFTIDAILYIYIHISLSLTHSLHTVLLVALFCFLWTELAWAGLIEILSDQSIVPPAAYARSQDGRGTSTAQHSTPHTEHVYM